jgi:hypothetical protein
MNKLIAAAILFFSLFVAFGGVVSPALAGQSCKKGAYFDASLMECVMKVRVTISAQDAKANGGPQWGPPNAVNCARASDEMDRSAALCRKYDGLVSYDAKRGVVINGKTFEQCAKCCRQLREGMARWQQCFALGLAPRPDYATARRSAERMNCGYTY